MLLELPARLAGCTSSISAVKTSINLCAMVEPPNPPLRWWGGKVGRGMKRICVEGWWALATAPARQRAGVAAEQWPRKRRISKAIHPFIPTVSVFPTAKVPYQGGAAQAGPLNLFKIA